MKDLKYVYIGRLLVALFPYWIGFSWRDLKIARVLDVGYVKFWWRR